MTLSDLKVSPSGAVIMAVIGLIGGTVAYAIQIGADKGMVFSKLEMHEKRVDKVEVKIEALERAVYPMDAKLDAIMAHLGIPAPKKK